MTIDRRALLTGAAALPLAGWPGRSAFAAPPPPRNSLNAIALGVRSGAEQDQSKALQKAIDQAATQRLPLFIPPGRYRAAELKLPAGAQLYGMRGASHIVLERTAPLFISEGADNIGLSGLMLEGEKIPLVERTGIIQLSQGKGIRIAECDIVRAGGSIVSDNLIEDTRALAGGSGQNGNAVNVYRAANVTVRGNRIRNAAFSAVRGNAASHITITGNECSGLGEVALYSEFEFENATITGNTVDGAGMGISVTNFKEGGRLATVQGNMLRNITTPRPATDPGEGFGVGIYVEADTAVTGNVIENAAKVGISCGNGPYLRDVAVTGNVVRQTPYGVWVTVAKGAGAAVISGNLITGARRGAIVGMEWNKVVTSDLAFVAPGAYPQLSISGNNIR
jgi:putative cofactor-binding repeat protein